MKKRKRSAAAKPPTPCKPALALLRDPLKKIYVYSEGTFVLHNAAEIKKLVIKTPAFDVSCWLDLSQMRPGGDTVETEVHVSFANRSNVGYGKWQWSDPKLLALGDMTNRLKYLSATHIEVWVQQTTSFDNFAKQVEYAYQLARRPPRLFQAGATTPKLGRIRAARTMELACMNDKMDDKQDRLRLQEKIRRTQHKLVDAVESIVDSLSPEPATARSRTAERRQIANLLGAWQFCAKRACRRAHCCLGEPTECLRICMPVLDAGPVAGLLPRRKRLRQPRASAGP